MQPNFDQNILLSQRVDPTFDEPILNQTLRIAMYDEYHAYEAYKKVVEKFGFEPPFINILQAEEQHIKELEALHVKYGVELPTNDWAQKLQAPNSLKEAYEIGVAAEIDNISMYSHLLENTINADVKDMFYRLQAASYNNHLPALRAHVEKTLTNKNPLEALGSSSENVMEKFNEWSEIANKLATNQASPEDVTKLLSNTNLSFVGGMLLGAVGTAILTQSLKDSSQDEEE